MEQRCEASLRGGDDVTPAAELYIALVGMAGLVASPHQGGLAGVFTRLLPRIVAGDRFRDASANIMGAVGVVRQTLQASHKLLSALGRRAC